MRIRHLPLGSICVLAVLCLLGGTLASADEAQPPFDVRNFELLPLNDLERGEFARDHPQLVRRVMVLAKRIEKLRKHRAARKNPLDDGGRRIGEQIRQIEAQLAPLVAEAVKAVDIQEIDERLLAHVAGAPRGPHRTARYAMGLVLFVEGMPAKPRALLADLLPRVEGALLALDGQRKRLAFAAKQTGIEAKQREALLATLDQQVQRIEKRWWRLVDYVVPQGPRAAVHRVLPRTYQKLESAIQHVYGLPDLSASQGVRIRAMLEEVQAEASPDSSAVKRLQGEARDPETDGERKPAIQGEIEAAQYRLLGLQRWAVEESKRILTEAQWEALEAIPPRVSYQDRQATSVDLLKGVTLSEAQHQQLAAMRKELAPYRRTYQERRLKAAARGAMLGPDSPKMPGMQMEMANIQASGNALQRRFNGRVLLKVLTPEQVAAWVLTPRIGR